jgi:hypothetical protein
MLGRGEPNEAKIAEFREELNFKLNAYEKILSKQPYMAGQVSKTSCGLTIWVFLH